MEISGIGELVTALKQMCQSANTVNQTLARVFPQSISTSATAVAGAATLPANPVGFLVVNDPITGVAVKIPYYT